MFTVFLSCFVFTKVVNHYSGFKHDIYPGSHSLYVSYYGEAGVGMNKFQDKVATEKVIRHTNASSRSNILQHVQNPAKSKGSQRYFLQFQRKITETELKGIPWKSQRIPQDGMSIAIP